MLPSPLPTWEPECSFYDWQDKDGGDGILPGNGNTACFNFLTKNKAFLLFNRTFKGRPHGHSSHFFGDHKQEEFFKAIS